MSDKKEKPKKEQLKIKPGKLSLTKTVESGQVKQNFTHGRSKTVTVEVRKTRTFKTGNGGKLVEVKSKTTQTKEAPNLAAKGGDQGHLTADERESRMAVLKRAEEELKKQTEQEKDSPKAEPKKAISKPQKDDFEIPADGIITAPEPAKPKQEKSSQTANNQPQTAPAPAHKNKGKDLDTDHESSKPKGGKLRLKGDANRRSSGKMTVHQALSGMEGQRVRSLASMKRQREKALKKASGEPQKEAEKVIRDVTIPEFITVQELANRMAERTADVVKSLMKLGVMATATQSIDADTAELVVEEFGHKFKRVTEGDVENVLKDEADDKPEDLQPRPPVVTIMGHVDHGKTSLLDALRKTDVVGGEAGGITQHIGAYQVEVQSGKKISFIDTPGHEAFTAMRARGAKVTDIVILVVAADDGIMEQTKEAISHAKAAEVPIIVAINKIDKPEADETRVKNELMQHDLIAEEFGGEIMVVGVSAKTGENLDKLTDALLLQAEMMELKANPDRDASGVVLEAKLDQGKGVVATVLVQKGTMKPSQIVVAGPAYGRIRSMTDDKGKALKQAKPGAPVVILGLSAAPEAGDNFAVVENEKTARDIADYRARMVREQQSAAQAARASENLFSAVNADVKELPVIIKADVQGSAEAIAGSVTKFSDEEVSVRILHSGVGGITESDITLANSTGAMIIAFNVRAAPKAKELAQRENVNIRYYSIIYEVVDDVKAALSGMLSPTLKENFIGYAEIREVFNITKVGKVAGCMVTEGVIKRGCSVRLLRDNVVIHEGTLKTLKRFKDEVKEVKNNTECGMAFENYDDIRVGDQIECFEVEEQARTVS